MLHHMAIVHYKYRRQDYYAGESYLQSHDTFTINIGIHNCEALSKLLALYKSFII